MRATIHPLPQTLALFASVCLIAVCPPPALAADSISTSTEVIVRTAPTSLTITGISEDIAASVDEVRTLSLVVEAAGQGELTYSWSRTTNNTPDETFSCEGATCPLSDVQADTTYTYTATVTDETGASVSASVTVRVSATLDEFVNERITYPLLGVTIEANRHKDAHITVSIQPVGTDAFSRLLDAAGDTYLRPPAYSISVVGQPQDEPAFVGNIRISYPSPGEPVLSRAWATEDTGEPLEVLLVDESGIAIRLAATESAGWVTFETCVLGDFAALASDTKPLVPGAQTPTGTDQQPLPDTPTQATPAPLPVLSATRDSMSTPLTTLVVLASVAALIGVVALVRERRGRH